MVGVVTRSGMVLTNCLQLVIFGELFAYCGVPNCPAQEACRSLPTPHSCAWFAAPAPFTCSLLLTTHLRLTGELHTTDSIHLFFCFRGGVFTEHRSQCTLYFLKIFHFFTIACNSYKVGGDTDLGDLK
jgi:hypothetical protein